MHVAYLLLAATIPGHAFDSPVEFFQACELALMVEDGEGKYSDPKEILNSSLCIAYVRGVSETVAMFQPFMIPGGSICVPAGNDQTAIIRKMLGLVAERPALRNTPQRIAITSALYALHPCPEPSSSEP